MINNWPAWSDMGSVSQVTKGAWEAQAGIRERYRKYFEGDVFNERISSDRDQGDSPLLYPVGVNLVRMICIAQADALFGEWKDQIVHFGVAEEEMATPASDEACKLLSKILYNSNGNSIFWEADVERNAYGGVAFKVSFDLSVEPYIKWSKVPADGFHPIWDPDEPNKLLEVYVTVQMTGEQARAKYAIITDKDVVERIEHWTASTYENKVDGVRMDAFSGANPWGFVPFLYIPRMRVNGSWWGDALTEELIRVQDELNATLSDVGEAVNYNSHPTRWGFNLPRSFNGKNFPLGVNAFWDLGRVIGASPKPEVGLLQSSNPVPKEVFTYIEFLYNWGRTSSFAPAVVFGEDSDGSQRSGSTIELRMWPLVKYTRRSRAYMGEGVRRMIWMTGRILEQKALPSISKKAIACMINGTISPLFENVLPPDHQAIVDEVVKLLSTQPLGISLETAQKILGRGVGEIERIHKMYDEFGIQTPEEQAQALADQNQAKLDATAANKKTADVKEGAAGKAQPQVTK